MLAFSNKLQPSLLPVNLKRVSSLRVDLLGDTVRINSISSIMNYISISPLVSSRGQTSEWIG